MEPTGNLGCIKVDAGSATKADFEAFPHREVLSMSGLQVDTYGDYIGGEIRLASYTDENGNVIPLTGLSISGSLKAVLNNIRLAEETTVFGSYAGPAKAIVKDMKIY